MAQVASEQEISQILNLVGSVFPDHSLINRGESFLREQIKNKEYIPFVERAKDKHIIGHGGIFIHDGIGFLQGLVVFPEFRGRGIGRELSESRIAHCLENREISHIVLYSVIDHKASQSFYDDSFIPIGLCVESRNIFSEEDPLSQSKLSCEIALCKPKFNIDKRITTSRESALESKIINLYQSIGIKVSYDLKNKRNPVTSQLSDGQMVGVDLSDKYAEFQIKEHLNKDYVSIGILPDCQRGLGVLGFSKDNSLLLEAIKYRTGIAKRDYFIESLLKK